KKGSMKHQIEALKDELQVIILRDRDYQHRESPALIETLSWEARRQRMREIQQELRQLEAEPPKASSKACESDSIKVFVKTLGCPERRLKDQEKTPLRDQLAMAVEQAGESIIITNPDGL